MKYYIDDNKITLDELKKRIEETDLIHSRASILENLQKNITALQKAGISSLADLRKKIKTPESIFTLAVKTNIELEYLALLKREIEGYFPKPQPLKSYNWLPEKESRKIDSIGLKNSVLIFEALNTEKKRSTVSTELKIDIRFITSLYILADLSRIQWVSPVFARMLAASGYKNPESIAKADADKLCNELDQINKVNKFFNGKIGLRDIKRLVKAASYVS